MRTGACELAPNAARGERETHIAGIGVSAVETIDGRVGEAASLANADSDRQCKAGQGRQPEGGDESRLPDFATVRVRDDVKEQRGKREIDDVTVEFARGRGPEQVEASRQPTREDDRENGQDDRKGREHEKAVWDVADGAPRSLQPPDPLQSEAGEKIK